MSVIKTYTYTENELNEVLTAALRTAVSHLQSENFITTSQEDIDNYLDRHICVLARNDDVFKRFIARFHPDLDRDRAICTIVRIEGTKKE